MTQLQFEIICSIIEKGAPILAMDLCTALNNLVNERNNFAAELELLKTPKTEETEETKEPKN